ADELSAALTENPKLDLAQFFKEHYEERLPIVAVMRDGRVVSSNGVAPPEDLVSEARTRVASGAGRGFGAPRVFRGGGPGDGFGPPSRGGQPPEGRGGPGGPGGPGGFGGGRRGGLMARGGPWSPIIVNGQLEGNIIANPETAWEQLGPTLLVVGFALV